MPVATWASYWGDATISVAKMPMSNSTEHEARIYEVQHTSKPSLQLVERIKPASLEDARVEIQNRFERHKAWADEANTPKNSDIKVDLDSDEDDEPTATAEEECLPDPSLARSQGGPLPDAVFVKARPTSKTREPI